MAGDLHAGRRAPTGLRRGGADLRGHDDHLSTARLYAHRAAAGRGGGAAAIRARHARDGDSARRAGRAEGAVLIVTRRLVLRDFTEADGPAFAAYRHDPDFHGPSGAPEAEPDAATLFTLFLAWRDEIPRRNLQLGVFDRATGRLLGCAGLRQAGLPEDRSELGIELAAGERGRHRLALEIAEALLDHAFGDPALAAVVGRTTAGNVRVTRLARWLGATLAPLPNPGAVGHDGVMWTLDRASWWAWRRNHPVR
ncbi:GNAT family N-acetyltransferase [Rhodoplanes serenus]|uniref:GNAT family N-acetyltransferase n=1 Tax=Rhodoplanes serenus TaxID=200615 RepID=A0A9X5AU96_9BRAD|nr:GNAT family N-acetyltransferase [Rhodoplanes serenus]